MDTVLTGGYRLTPVLQIGADIYCDTKVIARRLEDERDTPSLYPQGCAALERAVSVWSESLFMSIIMMGLALGAVPAAIAEDRKKMVPGGFDESLQLAAVPSRLDHVRATLDLLEQHLGDGRPFLLGEAASLADFSVYHPLWGLRANSASARFLDGRARVVAWLDRVAAFGHGTPVEMDADEAVRVAREARPRTQPAEDPGDPSGRRVGDRVRVFPEAHGRDPVEGELIRGDAHSIAIRRHDERVGEVVVHFPREGMLILKL